jgi:hypothetical protein
MMRSSNLVRRKASRQARRTDPVGSSALLPFLHLPTDAESFRHNGFELEKVGNVVDERKRAPGVQEANGWRVSSRQHCRLSNPMKACGGGRQATIWKIGCIPLAVVVCAPFPRHAVALCQ